MKNKSILLVHRYYYPDTPAYAIMLHRIAVKLDSSGYQMNVFTSMPSYYRAKKVSPPRKEKINGINIYRSKLLPEPKRVFFLRIINSFIFSFIVFLKLLFGKKYSLVTVATTPPILASSFVKIACLLRKTPYLYHCQDLYPEIAHFSGHLKSKVIYQLLKKLDTHTCQNSIKTIVLSNDMKATLLRRGVKEEKIAVINNFIRSSENNEVAVNLSKYNIRENSFKFVFCGNLGKMQKLEMILNSFIKLIANSKHDIQLIFIGEGIFKNHLIRKSQKYINDQIIFTGYQPLERATYFLKNCDLGLIPIAEGVHKTAYPSKTMTNLICGLKSLVLVENNSELNNFFLANKLGYAAPPDDQDAIISSFNLALQEGKSNSSEKERIKKIALENFSEKHILNLWTKTISNILND